MHEDFDPSGPEGAAAAGAIRSSHYEIERLKDLVSFAEKPYVDSRPTWEDFMKKQADLDGHGDAAANRRCAFV
jgi:hypothetical protein